MPRAMRHPYRTALRNSVVSLVALSVAAILIVAWFRFAGKPLDGRDVGWAVAAVDVGAIMICCGHALLGAKIGARRASNMFRALLASGFIVFLFWLRWRVGSR